MKEKFLLAIFLFLLLSCLSADTNGNQFLQLLSAAILSVISQSPNTKTMSHYARIGTDATGFYTKVTTIDYDFIGLSYCLILQGKNLSEVASTINTIGQIFNKA